MLARDWQVRKSTQNLNFVCDKMRSIHTLCRLASRRSSSLQFKEPHRVLSGQLPASASFEVNRQCMRESIDDLESTFRQIQQGIAK